MPILHLHRWLAFTTNCYTNRKDYKPACDVINQLVAVVKKIAFTALLSLRADGTIGEQEFAVVEDTGRWMHDFLVGRKTERTGKIIGCRVGKKQTPGLLLYFLKNSHLITPLR